MVDIAEVLTNGIAFDPKNWRHGHVNDLADIPQAVAHLFDRIGEQHLRATLVRGVALLNYIAGRNTQDVDLIMALEDATRVDGLMVREHAGYFVWAEFEGLRVDLLLPDCAIHRVVQDRFTHSLRYGERSIPTATVEGMILLKLFALPSLYRQFQVSKAAIYEADLTALIADHHPEIPPLLDILTPHLLPSDIEELRKIVAEIHAKLRGRRFQT